MMKLVTTFKGKAIGFTLWKTKQRLIELWFCLPYWGESMHKHSGQNSELTFITGWAKFGKQYVDGRKAVFNMRPWKIGATLSIRENEYHCFYSTSWIPLVFVNNSVYSNGKEPVSASKNIEYYAI